MSAHQQKEGGLLPVCGTVRAVTALPSLLF